ncbi:MAG: SusC/RagA family TonB-linked outer membrane protein, partial [Tannerella sp.]|nr:SusC/RagA family TonB-linked outer membrane protein [Tannerella sp.]
MNLFGKTTHQTAGNNHFNPVSEKKRRSKWIWMMIWIGFLSVSANVYSQTKPVSIQAEDVSLETVLKQIESQSDFSFFYVDRIDLNRKVSISASNRPLNEVLNDLFGNTNIAYKTKDKQIILQQQNPITVTPKNKTVSITGTVLDENNEPVAGAMVVVKGTTRGMSTDVDGTFTIQAAPEDQLEVSFLGYQTLTIPIGKQTYISVALKPQANELDEVTIVAFGKQKKESVLAAVTTVRPSELKIPSSNLSTALAGRISGLISYQMSGEPGMDDANFFVRGVTSLQYASGPLILIDGVEMSSSDLSRMQPDDIASFSIMKDATATALYGARGANGVIAITTKEGREGSVSVSFRTETSLSMPTMKVEFADPITYMQLNNEAVLTRNKKGEAPYTREKIDNTMDPYRNQYVYPANDWYNMLMKDQTLNYRANLNVNGGGKVARYYVAATYNQDNGNLRMDKQNNFNNNIDLKRYLLRSNVNINLTKTTEAVVRLSGTFDDYQG